MHVTSLPKQAGRVRQVAFTEHRMFVLTEKGQLYAFRIDIQKTSTEERLFAPQKPQYTGELFLDKPIHVKDMP